MNPTAPLITSLSLLAILPGQEGIGQGHFKEIAVTEAGYEGMVYHLFTPDGTVRPRTHGTTRDARYPLVFALHGNGQDAKSHVRSIAHVSSAELPVFVVAPQYQKEKRFNAPVYPGAGEVLETILTTLLDTQPIDKSRVILQGFSMGSNYSTTWIDRLARQMEKGGRLPFRAVWLNSTAIPPRRPAPAIPFLLFVGEKETDVRGRTNVLENVRVAYRRMFTTGLDVRYIEIPGMGHGVGTECHRIMREHLASLRDHGGAIPTKLAAVFPDVNELVAWGRFEAAFARIDQVLTTGDSKQKSKARSTRGRIRSYIKRLISSIGRKKQPTLKDHQIMARMTKTLSERKTLIGTLRPALRKLGANERVAAELTAWREFTAAQQAAKEDWNKSVAAVRLIADGPHKDTVYGRRARTHVQALGAAKHDRDKRK